MNQLTKLQEEARESDVAYTLAQHSDYKVLMDILDSIVASAYSAGREEVLKEAEDKLRPARTRDYYRPDGSEYREGEHDGWNEYRDEALFLITNLRDKE